MSTTLWIILAAVNLPVYFGLGWVIFRDWDDFTEAIGFWFTPDVFSMFRGEYLADWFAELKLGAWFAGCGGSVYGEAYLIQMIFR